MGDTIASAGLAQANVAAALRQASAKSGIDFDYLYNVALRESSLDPSATAKTSSAAGLFQFIEQTWLGAVKEHGDKHGLAQEASQINRSADGRYTVKDPMAREAILNLRFDPHKAAALASEFAEDNKATLQAKLGRTVNGAELYAAHFLGAGGAVKLLSAPLGQAAATLLPAAASANRGVFYDGARARSVGEILKSFERTIGVAVETAKSVGASLVEDRPAISSENVLASDVGASKNAPSTTRSSSSQLASAAAEISPLAMLVLQSLDPMLIAKPSHQK